MVESKSMFARRIKKPLWYVTRHVKRGNIVLDARGRVQVEQSRERLSKLKPGRPKLSINGEKIVRVEVWIKRKKKKILKDLVKEIK
jgi:hypothetical protein